MKNTSAIAGMLLTAAVGASAAGWIVSSHPDHDAALLASESQMRAIMARTPVGDLSGLPVAQLPLTMHNPLGEGPGVVAVGHQLFIRMNCAGCHNYSGRGGMGPDLADTQWLYGGTPVEIYKTIYEGRAKGMPAWGRSLPPEVIWELTAYVGSLGGGVPPEEAQAARQGDYFGDKWKVLAAPPTTMPATDAAKQRQLAPGANPQTDSP